jgi:1-acyl-sn-glycerol-3-phosphate acyltransferase
MDRYRRRALRKSIEWLVSGQLLVVFPEGCPNIDPHSAPRKSPKELLPFKAGFAAIAATAKKGLHDRLPIIPAGLLYKES